MLLYYIKKVELSFMNSLRHKSGYSAIKQQVTAIPANYYFNAPPKREN
jgi:hypothetical protein